jgi:hypothetical protein
VWHPLSIKSLNKGTNRLGSARLELRIPKPYSSFTGSGPEKFWSPPPNFQAPPKDHPPTDTSEFRVGSFVYLSIALIARIPNIINISIARDVIQL